MFWEVDVKKRALFALGGVAALSLAVSPFLLTNASAVAEPDETIAIDYVDVTNGDDFVIKDQSLSDSLTALIEGDPYREWCATINEDNELVEIQPGEDPSPFLCFFIDPDVEGDKVIVYDDYLADELIIFENQGVKLEVNMRDETVWLNVNQMGKLFDRDSKKIRKNG